MESVDVLVVGGGSAGLSVSHELAGLGIDHVVLERGRIGQTWRDRWDSFCLVTPNWSVRLPGGAYAGDDPDGFMPRDEIVAHLERYAATLGSPVREGVAVRTIDRAPGGFVARTSAGDLRRRARRPGDRRVPARPPSCRLGLAAGRPPADRHRGLPERGRAFPRGRSSIVGSGQSGAQLAEELSEAGRDVVLACGKAPWAPRRLGGRDVVWWLEPSGFFDQPVASLPSPAARLGCEPDRDGTRRRARP